MSRDAVANPSINGSGQVTFPANQYCTWKTNNGSTSIVRITNPSTANALTVVISGAPVTVLAEGSTQPLNGEWQLPPNSPTSNVTAAANFQGTTVTITNTSNPSAPCFVSVVEA